MVTLYNVQMAMMLLLVRPVRVRLEGCIEGLSETDETNTDPQGDEASSQVATVGNGVLRLGGVMVIVDERASAANQRLRYTQFPPISGIFVAGR